MSQGPKRKTTADALVFYLDDFDWKILLIKRKYPPFDGDWAFPGGFIEANEIPRKACIRELEEETGMVLSDASWNELATRQKLGRDPRGDTITYPFMTIVSKKFALKKNIQGLDDAIQAQWISLKDIEKLAFDHGAILCEAVGRLHPISGDKIVFYSGSFNPPHDGHRACVQMAIAAGASRVLIVPDHSPWKEQKTCPLECYWKKFRYIENYFKDLPVNFYAGFFGKELPNPTADWLPDLSVSHKILLMGDDSFFDLPKWKSPDKLLASLSELWVVPRQYKLNECQKFEKNILALAPNLRIKYLDDHPHKELSSSKLRLPKDN